MEKEAAQKILTAGYLAGYMQKTDMEKQANWLTDLVTDSYQGIVNAPQTADRATKAIKDMATKAKDATVAGAKYITDIPARFNDAADIGDTMRKKSGPLTTQIAKDLAVKAGEANDLAVKGAGVVGDGIKTYFQPKHFKGGAEVVTDAAKATGGAIADTARSAVKGAKTVAKSLTPKAAPEPGMAEQAMAWIKDHPELMYGAGGAAAGLGTMAMMPSDKKKKKKNQR